MENELQTVLSNTYTTNDAFRRLGLARQFIEQTFFTDEYKKEDWRVALERFLVDRNGEPATRASLAAWGEEWFKKFTPSDMNEKFAVLERTIEDLPNVTVVVPIVLPPAEVSRLGQWVRVNVHAMAMLSLRSDPEAVGGCIIIWQGFYMDVSLRYFFTLHRDALVQMIHEYK